MYIYNTYTFLGCCIGSIFKFININSSLIKSINIKYCLTGDLMRLNFSRRNTENGKYHCCNIYNFYINK